MSHAGNPFKNVGRPYLNPYIPPIYRSTFWTRNKLRIRRTIFTLGAISLTSVVYNDIKRRFRILDIAMHNSRSRGSYFTTVQLNLEPPGYGQRPGKPHINKDVIVAP